MNLIDRWTHCGIRVFDYTLSLTEGDDNAIRPLKIDISPESFRKFFETELICVKNINELSIVNQYDKNNIRRALANIGNNIVLVAPPWYGIEIQNMEANIFNEQVQPEFVSDSACELLFEHLNFFDLAKLQRVSSHFLKPIFKRLFVYSNRKSDLFLNFDLSEFLRKIDDGKVDQTRKFITIYEFRFIIRHFGHQMESIRVQTDCLKTIEENFYSNDITTEYENLVGIIIDILKEFIDTEKCDVVYVDLIKIYTDKDKDKDNYLQFKNFKNFFFKRDFHYLKSNNHLSNFDMIESNIVIDAELLENLSQKPYLTELKMLSEYPQFDRKTIIKFLEKLKLTRIIIRSHSIIFVYPNCDDLLKALSVNSGNSLLELHVNIYRNENLINEINRFLNLETLIIENITDHLINNLTLPKLQKLRIINCNFDGNFYFNFIRKHKALKYLDISNSGSVAGTFLRELDAQLNDNLFEMYELEINITNTPAGYLVNRGEILITNEKLKIKNENKKKYSDDEISLIIGDLCDLSDLSINECFDLASNHEVPLSFKRILLEFQNDLHLNLLNYFHLSKNCLKFISSLRNIRKLTINTYYPKLNFEKITKVLNNYEIPEIAILGYNTDDADERNSLNSMLIGIEDYSATHLTSLEFSNCSIGPGMIKILNKFTNLTSLTFSKVRGLLEQSFDSLCLPKVETIALHECSEVDDVLCNKILKSFPNVKNVTIIECELIQGIFLREHHRLNIEIIGSPAVLKYFIGEIPFSNNRFYFKDETNLFSLVVENQIKLTTKTQLLQTIEKLDLTKYEKLLPKLNLLHNLSHLIMCSPCSDLYVPTISCNLEFLEIINENMKLNDHSGAVIDRFAQLNSDCLKKIRLVKCKINIQCILSLNKLNNLEYLILDEVAGLSNDALLKLSSSKLNGLGIINNNELNNETCLRIIDNNACLINLCVYNCQSITEVILKELCALEFIRARTIYVDISGTPAGYHYILNQNIYSFDNCVIRNNSYETHLAYIKRILLDSKTVSSLPVELISMFQPTDQLDLTDSLPNLNDLSFELISQLDKLRRVKMFSHYRNVSDRQQMVKNISNLNLERLTIEGNNEPDCEDIIEAIAARKPNDLLEISIRNCTITTTLLESLNKFRNLHVIMISNENGNYLRKVLEEFEFSTSPVYNIYVNDRLIENNKVFLENIRRSVLNP